MFRLTPHLRLPDLTHLTEEMLVKNNIHFLLLDVDNTIAPPHSVEIEERMVTFICSLQEKKLVKGICIISNSGPSKHRRQRVKDFATQLNITCIVMPSSHQMKPRTAPFKKALQLLGAKPEETAIIGDQLFTDILGGRRAGITTILVTPLGKDDWFTYPKRWIERLFLRD